MALLPFDICENNHGGNAESREAFETLQLDLAGLRLRIGNFIKSCGDRGATVDEIEVCLGMRHQTVSARASELKALGVITKSGIRRKTRSGRNAAVLVAVTDE